MITEHSSSHSHSGSEPVQADHLNYSREVDSPITLFIVYGSVLAMTFLQVGLWSIRLGSAGLPVQLCIASIQAGIVAYYFMHLKYADRVVVLTALASIFWMGILFVLFMADYMTRTRIVGW